MFSAKQNGFMLNLFSAIKKKCSLLLFCRINKPQVQRLFMKIIKHGNFYNITYTLFLVLLVSVRLSKIMEQIPVQRNRRTCTH